MFYADVFSDALYAVHVKHACTRTVFFMTPIPAHMQKCNVHIGVWIWFMSFGIGFDTELLSWWFLNVGFQVKGFKVRDLRFRFNMTKLPLRTCAEVSGWEWMPICSQLRSMIINSRFLHSWRPFCEMMYVPETCVNFITAPQNLSSWISQWTNWKKTGRGPEPTEK